MEDIVDIENFTAAQIKIYESVKTLKTILSHVVVDGEILDITPLNGDQDYQIVHGVLHFLFDVQERISETQYEKSVQKLEGMSVYEKSSWLRKLPHLRIGESN